MNTQREQLIQTWLTDVFHSDQFEIKYLAGDASFRRYARVQQNNKTFMLMDAPPDKEDCAPFVRIDNFLNLHGVRVPKILAQDLTLGFLLLEDFGDILLANLLNDATVDQHYLQSFKQLLALQTIDGTSDFPIYSREKLILEMQLLTDWLLPALKVELTESEQMMIQSTFSLLADNALAQPQVIVHRDFHSRNLMYLADETDLGVIDFQDAVIGADTYDLISITRDAYVQWPPHKIEAWFEQFYQLLPESSKQNRDLAQFKQDADYMSLQRHIKILGIFVRLFERDGKSGYLKDLPRVMWYVLNEAQDYAELTSFVEFMQQRVLPAFTEKYGVYEAIS
ncbi:aminoglycoside phosphotransferase family protein [Acinetobacter sp. MD2]|uniref:aminoglycoside phosphotransferase family protein n=1 Tax=Acinetobacter sp. MD2 TaxID=2600066 RepID=UPI002D1F2BB0|nr:phosphotransferase [Acinetobacter sp. MD2]MEB3766662.1 phosphotransferase [Acinetobacter sp. MD2]